VEVENRGVEAIQSWTYKSNNLTNFNFPTRPLWNGSGGIPLSSFSFCICITVFFPPLFVLFGLDFAQLLLLATISLLGGIYSWASAWDRLFFSFFFPFHPRFLRLFFGG
jgi:hypothetical protein